MKQLSFVDDFLAGRIPEPEKEIEEYVSRWHSSRNPVSPLHDWLGMTWEEYSLWVEEPVWLQRILDARVLEARLALKRTNPPTIVPARWLVQQLRRELIRKMKIHVTLKDPDGFYDCVKDAVKEEVDKVEGLDADEKEELVESRLKDAWDELEKWVSYKEYVTVEFNTKESTARVLEKGED